MTFERWNHVYLAPDDGAGTPSSAPEPIAGDNSSPVAESAPQTQETATQQIPAYFSQMKKESREKYQALSKYKTIDELAEAASKADQVKEPDYTGYIKMPTKESTTEELKDFMAKLGVPEGPDKYVIPMGDNPTELQQSLSKMLREASFRSGMTSSQAKNMWGVLMAVVDTAVKSSEAQQKDKVENFDSRYQNLFAEQYQQKAQRDGAVRENLGHFGAFLNETGLGKVFEETGTLYDERIVKAIGEYHKKVRGQYQSGSQGGGSEKVSRTGMVYSDDFYKQYGGR